MDELFGNLERVRELTDAIVIGEPGANLIPPGPPVLGVVSRDGIRSMGSTRPGPANEQSQEHEISLDARASSPHDEVASTNVSINMCRDEFLYLTRSPPNRHPNASWDEQVYLAGVGRQTPSTQPSSDNIFVDLEAGTGALDTEVHHGAPAPGAPGFWQRLSAARLSVWRVVSTILMTVYDYVRPAGGLPTHRQHHETGLRSAMEQEMQTESESLFLGRLRGYAISQVQDGRTEVYAQVNDNAELLIQGSYVPTLRDPFTGEMAREGALTRIAPNGTPFLVPDVNRGITTAYFQRKTWRLIYALEIRDTFNNAIFAAVDDIVKSTWMRKVFDFANPFPRIRAAEPAAEDSSSTDSEMPGWHSDTVSDAHSRAAESSSTSSADGGDAFAEAFRMMMQRNRGDTTPGADAGADDTAPASQEGTRTAISQAVQRAGRNLTQNTGMTFVTFHQFDHGQRCHMCGLPLLQEEETMVDYEGRGVHSRCLMTLEPDSPDSTEREDRLRVERIAHLEEDLRATRAQMAEHRTDADIVARISAIDTRTTAGVQLEHVASTQLVPPARPGRESFSWQVPVPRGSLAQQQGRTGRESTMEAYVVAPYVDSPIVRQVLTTPRGDVEAPDAVIEQDVGHEAPPPGANPYDFESDGHTRYGARVPASVASQRRDPAIPPDTQVNRWPPVSESRPLAAEEAHVAFDPLRYPSYRTLVSAMSQIKNKFVAYVRGMFSDDLVTGREEKGRRIWEMRQSLPHRFALGGEWTSAPLILGREPAHTEQFTKYDIEVNKRTHRARIGPHPTSLWTKRVLPDGTEVDDGVLDLAMAHNPPPLQSPAEIEAQAVVDELCPPPTVTAGSGAAHRAGATSPYVRIYEHPPGQSPFQRYHNIFAQLDMPYDVITQKGNWFAEDLPMFITSLDRTCRYAMHPYTDTGMPAGLAAPDPTDGAILVGIPADLHASVLLPPGGPQPSVPRRVVHSTFYAAGSTRGGSIVQWIGNSINDDAIWGRSVLSKEFAFDLHAMRHERSRVAKKIWQEKPENRYHKVSDASRCYPSVPFARRQVCAKMFDSIYLASEEATYSASWDHNTAHSVGHAGHGSINWRISFQRRPGSYRQRARLELRRSTRGFQRAEEALSRKLPTYLEVMPQWSKTVVHDTDFALLSLTSFVSSDRVAMWFWHANQAVLDVGQPARVFPLVYVQAHEPFDKPLVEYGKTPTPHADVVRIAYADKDGRLMTDSFLIKRKKGDSPGWQQADLRDALQLINKCIRVLRYRRYNPDLLQIDEVIQQRWERRVLSAVMRNRTKSWRAAVCSNCGHQNLLLGARENAKTISHCQFIAASRDETEQLHRPRRNWGVEPRMGLVEARRQEEGWHRAKFCPCLTAVWCSTICANDVAHGESHYWSDGHRRYTVLMVLMQTKVNNNRDFAKEMVIQILRYLRVLHGHSYGAMPFFWKF